MATIQDEARQLIDALPDDCRWEDALYRFYVRQRLEGGLRDIDEGRVISQEELEREVETWFRSTGAAQPART